MLDDEYFDRYSGRYRVRAPNPGEVPGADPDQAILVARVAPGQYLRHPLPDDLDYFEGVSDDDLAALAAETPFAADRDNEKFVSFDDVRQRFEQQLKKRKK